MIYRRPNPMISDADSFAKAEPKIFCWKLQPFTCVVCGAEGENASPACKTCDPSTGRNCRAEWERRKLARKAEKEREKTRKQREMLTKCRNR